jgi:hypothetical protein
MGEQEEGRMIKVMDKPTAVALRARRVAARSSADVKRRAFGPHQKTESEWPAEGPHARPDLVNEAATPGSGLFSSKAAPGGKVNPGAG